MFRSRFRSIAVVLVLLACGGPPPPDPEPPTECLPPFEPLRTNQAFAVAPSDELRLYVAVEGEGVFRSTDGGDSWARSVEGIAGRRRVDSERLCYEEPFDMFVHPTDAAHVCFAFGGSPGTVDGDARYGGMYCSNDGGDSWAQTFEPWMNGAVSSLAIAPSAPTTFYAGSNGSPASRDGADQNEFFNETGVVYQSMDSGQTWRELPTGFMPNLRVFSMRVHPTDADIVYATTIAQPAGMLSSTQLGVLETMNAGESWSSLTGGLDTLGSRAVWEMDLSPRSPMNLFIMVDVGDATTNYYSANGGTSWQRSMIDASVPVRVVSVFAFDPHDASGQRMIAGESFSDRVLESLDGGASWHAWGMLPAGFGVNRKRLTSLRFAATTPGLVYGSGSFGSVIRSEDGGVSWTVLLDDTSFPP